MSARLQAVLRRIDPSVTPDTAQATLEALVADVEEILALTGRKTSAGAVAALRDAHAHLPFWQKRASEFEWELQTLRDAISDNIINTGDTRYPVGRLVTELERVNRALVAMGEATKTAFLEELVAEVLELAGTE
jgi:hypothetical protein